MEIPRIMMRGCDTLYGLIRAGMIALPLSACAMPLDGPRQPVPASYFGLHIHRAAPAQSSTQKDDEKSPWPGVRFGAWRLWDAYVAWPNLEPRRGAWSFERLDKYVAMAVLGKVEALLPLGLAPQWASARPNENSSYRPGNAAEPLSAEDWRTYVRTVAIRYKGRIRTYELWNEVNLKGFYSGSPEKLVELARIAYETLKAVDPDVTVVSPSVTGEGRHLEWLDRYLALGGGQYADVIGYHFYVPKKAPEAMLPLIREVRRIMDKHGQGHKPLWNTESGWWIANKSTPRRIGAAGGDWLKLDNELSSAYVARALVLGWSSGLSRFYWYAWDNFDMGLIDAADKSLKPAGAAYDRVAGWLLGAVLSSCADADGVWICELTDAQGRPARIVWREDGGERPWSIPLAWSARQAELLDGRVLEIPGYTRNVRVGQSPLIIR